MNVLSLFDGMSCGQIALERAGVTVNNYYASEIDKYAIKVTQANFPNTVPLGDIKKHNEWNLPEIDLIIAGFPCQAWSTAGKMKGDNDPRGALVHDLIEVWGKYKPKYFLFENVKMKKEFMEYINTLFGVEPILINSALVSAQNRKRYYWTNIPGIEQPVDKGIDWGDVRENGVSEESFYYSDKAMQWLGRNSQKRNKALDVHLNDEKMQMIEASHYKKYSQQRFFGIIDNPEIDCSIGAMRGRFCINGKRQDGKVKTAGKTVQYIEFRRDLKSNALSTVTKDNVVVPFTLPNRVPAGDFLFRYITPVECERLQTLDDNYTNHVSNTQRYKMIGNGFTVDVIAHILKGLI